MISSVSFSSQPVVPKTTFFQRLKNRGRACMCGAVGLFAIGAPISWMNTAPKSHGGNALTVRDSFMGIPYPVPKVYVQNDGSVVGPLTKIKKGSISPNGVVSSFLGFPQAHGQEEKIYKTVLPVSGLAWPVHSGSIKAGNVYEWGGWFPTGYVSKRPGHKLTDNQVAASGFYVLNELDTNNTDGSNNRGNKSSSKK